MTAILRDRINDLLTANADLEREVVRLRYADAARGAAESVETLKRLRNTRDTLNDIVTENDQLKIEVSGVVSFDTNLWVFSPLIDWTSLLLGWKG